jgi:hypothetical protein
MKHPRLHTLTAVATTFACLVAADRAFRRSDRGFSLAAESRYVRKARLYDRSPGVDIAFTGDSRIVHGIDVDTVERVVADVRGERLTALNAGLAGASPMTQLAWVRRFLTKAKRPRVVVMAISPYMFSSAVDLTMSREALHTIYRARDLPAMVRAGAPPDDLVTVLTSDLFEAVRLRPRLMQVLWRDAKWTSIKELTEPRFFELPPAATAAIQNQYAHDRAVSNIAIMGPPATFGGVQMGYFIEALRELTSAGVTTAVMNTHSASQMELAYGPKSFYEQHIRYVKEQAARFGVPYFDAQHTPVITDIDFFDADHLGGAGARRLSAWIAHRLVVPLLGGPRVDRPAGCRPVADFEAGLADWRVDGTMVRAAQAGRTQTVVIDYRGEWFLDSFGPNGDVDTGRARSAPFAITTPTVRLRVGGGNGKQVGAALVIDGARVVEARGANDERLREVVWDVRAQAGKSAQVEIWDEAKGAWGHILVDDVALCP